MKPFRYIAPATVDEAVGLLGEGSRCMVGGSDLIVQMRAGRRHVEQVVDLKRVAELAAIAADARGVSIGAAVTISDMAAHPALAPYPAVVSSARMIGSLQVQNRASIAGNVCNAAPSADAVPALICLGATATVAGPAGRREQTVESLFTGPGRTAIAADELLVAIRLPPAAPASAACYLRFTPRREMDIAVAGAAAWLRLGGDGRIADARIALASVGPTPLRAREAAGLLVGAAPGETLFEEAGRLAAREARPLSDTRGSADYRRELVATLTRRALAGCLDRIAERAAA